MLRKEGPKRFGPSENRPVIEICPRGTPGKNESEGSMGRWKLGLLTVRDLLKLKRKVSSRCSLLAQVIVDRLFDRLEGVRVEARILSRQELDRPLVNEFLGSELFPDTQFGERTVELERRNLGIGMPD